MLKLSKFVSCKSFLKIRNSVLQIQKYSKAVCELDVQHLKNDEEGIAVMCLHRPGSKNALNRTLTFAIDCALDNIQYEKHIKVLIVRSLVSGVFCAGADLKERQKFASEDVSRFVTKLRSVASKIENLSVPVIAALDGTALGGGLEIALACDIRTGVKDCKLGLVETKLGIIPGAGGTQRLPRLVGIPFAKELIFTARIINGVEAYERGLLNHVVDQNETGDAAYEKALELARQIIINGPLAVQLAKVAINKGIEVDMNSGLAIEGACYERVIPTKDRIEGLKAFNENRRPIYIGE